MNDDLLALGRVPQALRIGHRPDDGVLIRERGARPGGVLEYPHRVPVVDEPLHDRRADEAGRAGDENLHDSKFFQ